MTQLLETQARSPKAGQDWRSRFAVNITPAERVGRVVLGVVVTAFAIALLVGAGSVLAVILEVFLVLAGLDLVVTGALGYCPLYHRLGYTPRSLGGPV